MEIIIRGKSKFGRTRSEQEINLRKEGMQSLTDEQLDRCKFLEKKFNNETGGKESFAGQHIVGGEPVKPKSDE
jgi:hypothetical protein